MPVKKVNMDIVPQVTNDPSPIDRGFGFKVLLHDFRENVGFLDS